MIKINKISNVSELYKKFQGVLKRASSNVIVDLEKLVLFDTATIQLMLVFANGVEQKGYQVSWKSAPIELRNLTEDIGLSHSFDWD